jgi:hypothetical protein
MVLQFHFASGFRTVATKHLLHKATNTMNHSFGHFPDKRPEADLPGPRSMGRSGAIWYEFLFARLDPNL